MQPDRREQHPRSEPHDAGPAARRRGGRRYFPKSGSPAMPATAKNADSSARAPASMPQRSSRKNAKNVASGTIITPSTASAASTRRAVGIRSRRRTTSKNRSCVFSSSSERSCLAARRSEPSRGCVRCPSGRSPGRAAGARRTRRSATQHAHRDEDTAPCEEEHGRQQRVTNSGASDQTDGVEGACRPTRRARAPPAGTSPSSSGRWTAGTLPVLMPSSMSTASSDEDRR